MSSMLSLVASVLVGAALAKGPPVEPGTEPEPEPLPPWLEEAREQGLMFSVKAVGEIWEAPEIVQVYKGSTLMIGAGVVLPVHRYLVLDAELAYERVGGTEVLREEGGGPADTTSTFTLLPMSLLIEGRLPVGSGGSSVFLGAGPSLAVWKEEFSPVVGEANEHLPAGSTNISGARLATEVRGGVRLETSIRPAPSSAGHVDGLSVELGFGRRIQKEPEVDGGLDLAAWRGGVALGVRLR